MPKLPKKYRFLLLHFFRSILELNTDNDCEILFLDRYDICKGINEPCETLGKQGKVLLPFANDTG